MGGRVDSHIRIDVASCVMERQARKLKVRKRRSWQVPAQQDKRREAEAHGTRPPRFYCTTGTAVLARAPMGIYNDSQRCHSDHEFTPLLADLGIN